jgi:hypothetical protein
MHILHNLWSFVNDLLTLLVYTSGKCNSATNILKLLHLLSDNISHHYFNKQQRSHLSVIVNDSD